MSPCSYYLRVGFSHNQNEIIGNVCAVWKLTLDEQCRLSEQTFTKTQLCRWSGAPTSVSLPRWREPTPCWKTVVYWALTSSRRTDPHSQWRLHCTQPTFTGHYSHRLQIPNSYHASGILQSPGISHLFGSSAEFCQPKFTASYRQITGQLLIYKSEDNTSEQPMHVTVFETGGFSREKVMQQHAWCEGVCVCYIVEKCLVFG